MRLLEHDHPGDPPIVVRSGQPMQAETAARTRFLTDLSRALEWVERSARCENDQQRERLASIFRSAHEALTNQSATDQRR